MCDSSFEKCGEGVYRQRHNQLVGEVSLACGCLHI